MSFMDATVWKCLRVWHLQVLAGVLLPLGLLLGLQNGPDPSAAEKAILRNLAIYNVRYELDEDHHVEDLNLDGKEVTDEAVNEICKLAHLRRLSLEDSSVTDAGMLKISKLRQLKRLQITDTYVTDRGLKYLEQVKSLRWVFVSENKKLTSRGIASLQRALPALHVVVRSRKP
jgi:hypothetical protein